MAIYNRMVSLAFLRGWYLIKYLQEVGASPVAQLVKNLPAMQETWVWSWIGKIPWRRERLLTPVFWPGEFHGLYSSWGCKESDMTEWLSLSPGVCSGQHTLIGTSHTARQGSQCWPLILIWLLTAQWSLVNWQNPPSKPKRIPDSPGAQSTSLSPMSNTQRLPGFIKPQISHQLTSHRPFAAFRVGCFFIKLGIVEQIVYSKNSWKTKIICE